jgi:predicted nucleic acid-binding Zn ribbon protein
MPTYVYKFVDTGETIEVHQAFTEDALTEAPDPSDGTLRPVRKVFTPVGITFKGNGFYKTDSRGKTSSTSSSSNSSSESSSSSSSESSSSGTSSDSSSSKPDAKSNGDSKAKSNSHSHGGTSHSH